MMAVVLNRRDLPRGVIPPGAVYVGRPTKWGNPFLTTDPLMPPALTKAEKHQMVVGEYRKWIQTQPHLMASLRELSCKDLACWCSPLPCHADVLLELAAEAAG